MEEGGELHPDDSLKFMDDRERENLIYLSIDLSASVLKEIGS
jgi:hypothetical protein